MTKDKSQKHATEAEIYAKLSSLLERTDVASLTYQLSSVALKCDDNLLEAFLNDKPPTNTNSFHDFMQGQLYTASFWGFYDVVKALIEYGADLNHVNKETLWTPLHAACFQEHFNVVELLLENNAKVNLKDFEGRTSIDIASASDKIWLLFSSIQKTRTSVNDLVSKGLIREDILPAPVTKTGIVMADYTPPSTKMGKLSLNSSNQMKAVLGGDVLAESETSRTSSRRASSRSSSSTNMSSLLQWN